MSIASRRDDRLDFLRGIALLVIFIDHVPHNLFEPFTLHAFAFCDAAEVFFFISGYVAALVYGRVLQRHGFLAAAKKAWRRASVVYGAQLALLVVIVALVPLFILLTGNPDLRYIFRVPWVYEAPLAHIIPALTMHFQPGFLDILPVYVLLLMAFPLVLAGLNRNIFLVLVPSFVLWLAVQLFGLTLWNTAGERWFFNPFAWQFLFIIGAVFGHPVTQGRFAFLNARWLLAGAFAIAIPVALIQFSQALDKFVWWIPDLHFDALPLDKTNLQPLRLVSFLALAVIARRYLPQPGVLTAWGPGLTVIRCGRFSLQIFSLGVVLASLTVVTMLLSGNNVLIQSLACVAGVAVQIGYGAWRDRQPGVAPLLPAAEPRPETLAD